MVNTTFFAALKEIKAQSTAQTHFNIHNTGSSQFTQTIFGQKADIMADIVNVAIFNVLFIWQLCFLKVVLLDLFCNPCHDLQV